MREHPGTFVAGLLFMVVGVVYALEGFDVWTVRPGRLWPVALIAIGVVVLFSGRDRAEPPAVESTEMPMKIDDDNGDDD